MPESSPAFRRGAALRSALIAAAAALAACSTSTPVTEGAAQPAARAAGADGMQAIVAVQQARETLPGKALYDQHCASCHNGAVAKAPHRDMLGLMTPGSVLHALDAGVMSAQASMLSPAQRAELAEYVTGRSLAEAGPKPLPRCGPERSGFDLARPPLAAGWGQDLANTRNISAAAGAITRANAPSLRLKWSLAIPGANRMRSQPTFAGGALLVGGHDGRVYALDAETGCVRWEFVASGEVRSGIAVSPWRAGDASAQPRAYFGDVLGNVYAIDAKSGALVWRQRTDDHPNATITGTPALHGDRVYVPVSSLEVALAVDPKYECCKATGAVVAYDAASGAFAWRTPTIAEPAVVQSQNRSGTDMYGPSGATIWNTPTIDAARGQLTIGTGENMSSPATLTSDAIMALDLASGAVRWSYQGTANDVWNTACDTATPDSCPPEKGPDFDFGAGSLLFTAASGKQLVVAGQKSGDVHALDPDTGALVWKTKVGRGGIQGGVHFGLAADGSTIYVPITDMADGRVYDSPSRPGLHALDALTGQPRWYSPAPTDVCGERKFCHPGVSQAITVLGDVVAAGAMDGVIRLHDANTGEVVWSYDTTAEHTTLSGDSARGGSLGGGAAPVAQGGVLVVSSGYGIYNHMPGNLLLAFTVAP
ncbi:MAG: PQQ-binding-like beta-propeller repeat protein [Deltaproteobacteria bacterium]|nr:PQQ-binding-like beta-propeller repeat protein [Deltaproteobacteria bacterium]